MPKGFPASRRAFKEYAISAGKEKLYQYLKQDDFLSLYVEAGYNSSSNLERNSHFDWILTQLGFRHSAAVVVHKLGNKQTGKLLRSIGLEILNINMKRLQAWDNLEAPPLPCVWPIRVEMTQADASAALRRLENLGLVKTDRLPGAKKRTRKVSFTLVGWQAFILQIDPYALMTTKGVWNNPDGRGVTLTSPVLQNEYVKFCESYARQQG